MDFIKAFYKKIQEKNTSWEVSALVSPQGKLFTLGNDTKLIGRIFELICYNILQEIADENGLLLYPAKTQTAYPDFTLMKSEDDKNKIAVDVKTTYRRFLKDGVPSGYVFTLGSYASYMRDGRKNITFPYSEYAKHYVIGFVYTRNEYSAEGEMFDIRDLAAVPAPYKDVEFFVQEKYKISGDKAGSGNTENIGSFRTNNMDILINGEGPFSNLGVEIYENYWSGYKRYRGEKTYDSLDGYFDFLEKTGTDVNYYKKLYEIWKETH